MRYKVLIVIFEFIGGLPLNSSPRCASTFRQGVLNRCLDIVLLHWWWWNWGKLIVFIGNGGIIRRLFVIVCCSPCDVRRSRGQRITRNIAVSATVVVSGMLSAPDGCSDMADGSEIPEILWITVVLAAEVYISRVQRNERVTNSSKSRACSRSSGFSPPSAFHLSCRSISSVR